MRWSMRAARRERARPRERSIEVGNLAMVRGAVTVSRRYSEVLLLGLRLGMRKNE